MWLRSMPGNDTAIKPIVRALMSPAFPVVILMVFLAVGFWLRSGLIEEDSRQVQIIFGSLFLLGLLTSLTTVLVQAILRRNQALLKTRKELEREIDQRKAVQKDLERLESTDTLTGLANRRFFMDDLAYTLSIADRQMRQAALILLDLDRFQMLNDSLGHQFGDELLIAVSERLDQLSDELVLVAYSGGDEFMVCQQQVDDIDDRKSTRLNSSH